MFPCFIGFLKNYEGTSDFDNTYSESIVCALYYLYSVNVLSGIYRLCLFTFPCPFLGENQLFNVELPITYTAESSINRLLKILGALLRKKLTVVFLSDKVSMSFWYEGSQAPVYEMESTPSYTLS